MEKDVILDITSRHQTADDEATISLTTVGTFSGDENDYTVVYTNIDGELAGCTTTVRVLDKKTVTVTQEGPYTSQFIIEKNRRHNGQYVTPYGEVVIGAFAKYIKSDVDENGGLLDFDYTLDFNSDLVSVNHMTISVKEEN